MYKPLARKRRWQRFILFIRMITGFHNIWNGTYMVLAVLEEA